MLERRVVPPYGLAGGKDGAPYRITVNPGTRGERAVKGKETVRLAAGDLVVIETCGGGGYGSPAERPPALTARDRRGGDLPRSPAAGAGPGRGAPKGVGWGVCMAPPPPGAAP